MTSPSERAATVDDAPAGNRPDIDAEAPLVSPDSRLVFDRFARMSGSLLGVPAVSLSFAGSSGPITLGSFGLPKNQIDSAGQPLAGTLFSRMSVSGAPLAIHDARIDEALSIQPALRESPYVAFLVVPLQLADGTVAGDLCAMSLEPRAWARADEDMLADMAATAARELEHQIRAGRRGAPQYSLPVSRLINILPVGLYACDGTGQLVFFNERAASMWGHSPRVPTTEAAAFARHRLFRLDGDGVPDDALPAATSLRERSTASNREYVMAPGRSVLVSWGPSLGEADQLLGAVVVMQDVTDLRRATRLRDDLLALVSHELRTPLTVINGMARVLERRLASGDDRDATVALEDILAAGRRMERVVENMLLLSRLEHESSEPEPILVTWAIDAALERHHRDFPRSSVELQLPDRRLIVQAVPSWLQLILVNLLRNAEQYGDGTRSHILQAHEANGAVDISLCNAGQSLRSSDYAGWFEPFYRGAGSSATVAGAGLGLTVARRLADAQGGSISARPWAERNGTMVTLTLPRPSEDL